jgi:hypothetical protein
MSERQETNFKLPYKRQCLSVGFGRQARIEHPAGLEVDQSVE